MIVKTEEYYRGYQLEMCKQNQIAGFLPMETVVADGKMQFWYDITGKQSIDMVLQNQLLKRELLEKVIMGIYHVSENMKPFLLEENSLLLQPQTIYMASGKEEILIGYCPTVIGDTKVNFRQLMEYFLPKMNHAEEEVCLIGYEIYQETVEDTFSIRKIVEIMRHKDGIQTGKLKEKEVQEKEVQDKKVQEKEKQKKEEIVYEKPIYKKKIVDRHIMWNKIWKKLLQKKKKKDLVQLVYEPEEIEKEIIENPTVFLGAEEKQCRGTLMYQGAKGRENLVLCKSPYSIGSKNGRADSQIEGDGISRMHAQITNDGTSYYIEDLNSINGTWLNDEILSYKEKIELHNNDRVRFAQEEYIFH